MIVPAFRCAGFQGINDDRGSGSIEKIQQSLTRSASQSSTANREFANGGSLPAQAHHPHWDCRHPPRALDWNDSSSLDFEFEEVRRTANAGVVIADDLFGPEGCRVVGQRDQLWA